MSHFQPGMVQVSCKPETFKGDGSGGGGGVRSPLEGWGAPGGSRRVHLGGYKGIGSGQWEQVCVCREQGPEGRRVPREGGFNLWEDS